MYEKYDKETMEWRVDSMLSAAQKGQGLTEKLSLIYAMYQECSDKVYEEWQPHGWQLIKATKAKAKAKEKARIPETQARLDEAESLLKRAMSLLRIARNYKDAH